MNDQIEYFCTLPEHQGAEPSDAVTMHEDRWAYCPSGARDAHDWRATGGMSLDDTKGLLRRQVATRDQRSD
jgi:hypothetical protein